MVARSAMKIRHPKLKLCVLIFLVAAVSAISPYAAVVPAVGGILWYLVFEKDAWVEIRNIRRPSR